MTTENKLIEILKKPENSKLQENIAEYSFLKDLLIDGLRNEKELLISRSDFDSFGFDVMVTIKNQEEPFQIQLKAYNGKAATWDIHKSLLKNKLGKVVIIEIKEFNDELKFKYFTLQEGKINETISTPSKTKKANKCKLKKGNLVELNKTELFRKLLIKNK